MSHTPGFVVIEHAGETGYPPVSCPVCGHDNVHVESDEAEVDECPHLAFIYLAVVGSVLAWTIYLWLLQRLDLSVLSTLGLVQPLLALALDLALRETQLHPRGYVGAALVLIGMALSTKRSTAPDPSPPPTEKKAE